MSTSFPSVPRHRPLRVPLILLVGLLVASIGVLIVSASLARASMAPLYAPLEWLASLAVADAFDTLSNAAEVVAAVLAIAITVVAIVVELAANRYSHQITRLFLREPVNLVVLGLLVITTLQCVWTAALLDGTASQVPLASVALTLGLVTLCLLLLVPYIYFVFTFLSPVSVVQRICRDAYSNILRARRGDVAHHQLRVEEAVDELQDVARSAIAQGDRGIAMATVDVISGLLGDYLRMRHQLPPAWFDITDTVAADPDFVALAPEIMAEVQSQGMWLERKVFRRYLSLMGQSTGHSRDVSNLIAMHTRQLAAEFGAGQPDFLELCMRSCNSYLRTTINARDPRTAYFVMNQYRIIGEGMLAAGRPESAVQVAGYLREYGQIAHKAGLSFLLEAAAFDVKTLVEEAAAAASPALDPLLGCLLELDQEIREESQEESLLGVRRTQVQIGARFVHGGDMERAARVARDLAGERRERLERIRLALLADDRPQFWELMDRGVNFAYLDPALRPSLDPLFDLVEGERAHREVRLS